MAVIRKRMGWAGRLIRIVELHKVFFLAKQNKKSNSEDLSVDGWVILMWIIMKLDGRAVLDLLVSERDSNCIQCE
jgi:hypothetical protein